MDSLPLFVIIGATKLSSTSDQVLVLLSSDTSDGAASVLRNRHCQNQSINVEIAYNTINLPEILKIRPLLNPTESSFIPVPRIHQHLPLLLLSRKDSKTENPRITPTTPTSKLVQSLDHCLLFPIHTGQLSYIHNYSFAAFFRALASSDKPSSEIPSFHRPLTSVHLLLYHHSFEGLEESRVLELLLECGFGGVYFETGYDGLTTIVVIVRREIRPGYTMRRRPAVVVSSSLSKMVEQSCLLGWRRRIHRDEESYVVVHCGLMGAWIYLSSSEMAFRIEGSLQSYNSWHTLQYAMRLTS